MLLQNFSILRSWGTKSRKENWTKKDMSCYAAFLSYFSSGWRSPLLWTILIPNEVRKKTSVGYECHAWNVRPLCLRWKWMSLLWSIFFVQVQDHICIACVKCGITRSSQKVSFTWFENYSKCLIWILAFSTIFCVIKIDLSLTLFDRK